MREQLKLRFARTDEAEQISQWIQATPHNDFDPDILTYPSLKVLCSYNGIGPMVYLPFQRATVLESVAVKPGLDEQLAAQSFRDLVKGAQLEANSNGVREIYFIATEENIKSMALNHGFTEITYPVLRMRL